MEYTAAVGGALWWGYRLSQIPSQNAFRPSGSSFATADRPGRKQLDCQIRCTLQRVYGAHEAAGTE